MRVPVAAAALTAAFVLMPVLAGYGPAFPQDFSITNPEEAANPVRRDVMRQLQAWWDLHAYYPRHASNNDEGGTVKIRLVIHADGNIWKIDVLGSSGSTSLDTAGVSAFRGGFVRPFPAGAPDDTIDIALHYVLAHRHDQPVAAGYTPVASKRPFTIANDPVTSPILETMLQRTCTGEVVKEGIRNHPMYGGHHWAQAVFFRKPDGTPWVKLYEGGFSTLSPVMEVGKVVQWTGREEHPRKNVDLFYHYTLWSDEINNLHGTIEAVSSRGGALQGINGGGTVELTCATEAVPAITWSALAVTPGESPLGDPP